VVPGKESGLDAVEVGGQIVDVIELVVVGTEGAFDASVALGVVGAVEVVGELEFADSGGELAEELRAAVRLDRLDGEGEAGEDFVQEARTFAAGQPGGESDHPLTGKAVDGAELKDRLAVRHPDLFAVHLNESTRLLHR